MLKPILNLTHLLVNPWEKGANIFINTAPGQVNFTVYDNQSRAIKHSIPSPHTTTTGGVIMQYKKFKELARYVKEPIFNIEDGVLVVTQDTFRYTTRSRAVLTYLQKFDIMCKYDVASTGPGSIVLQFKPGRVQGGRVYNGNNKDITARVIRHVHDIINVLGQPPESEICQYPQSLAGIFNIKIGGG